MKVILTWSGPRSECVATELYRWLRPLLPGTNLWISTDDIGKGTRWFPELMNELEVTSTCIICVTPESLTAPWIYYEAGAIAGKARDARVCPYLVGLDVADLGSGPLSLFQCTRGEKDDTWRLIRDLNRAVLQPRDEGFLSSEFEQVWPVLADALAACNARYESAGRASDTFVPAGVENVGISGEATDLLVEASNDRNGIIMRHEGAFISRASGGGGASRPGFPETARGLWGDLPTYEERIRHGRLAQAEPPEAIAADRRCAATSVAAGLRIMPRSAAICTPTLCIISPFSRTVADLVS